MKIAIAGYGTEGIASYRYFSAQGHDITIVDEREVLEALPGGVATILGKGAFEKLQGFDMVVRSPGLAPRKITTDGNIWSATNEFFARCPAPIIGVTGSKGKGTTTSLIASILQAAGKEVHTVGNIGVPALDELPRIEAVDIVVYELSSFQLWDAVKSPQVAVVLMIEPDHLDVHRDMAEYIEAKAQITRHQAVDDYVIFNATNQYSSQIAESSVAHKVGFQSGDSAHVRDGAFWYGEQKLCSVDALKLSGAHNQDNACAAIDAVWQWVQDGEIIGKGMAAFMGLPHRLKFVAEVQGVSFYDDSIATTPGSAIAAIRAFDQPKVLIVGGSSKGAEFDALVDELAASTSIRAVVGIGETGPGIIQQLHDKNPSLDSQLEQSTTMAAIVARAAASAQSGDVVILSPACASFDMFKNYADRGDQFISAVMQLVQ